MKLEAGAGMHPASLVAHDDPGPSVETVSQMLSSMQRVAGSGMVAVCRRDGATHLSRLYQEGAAKIRLPKTHSDHLQAVLINTAGGLTGGDRLSWDIACGKGSDLVVTTQACEKVYRSAGGSAVQSNRLSVDAGARLAFLPQETILFDRSHYARNLEARMTGEARLLVIEPIIFGRRAMGESVIDGYLKDSWRIYRNDRLIHAEETAIGPAIHETLSRAAIAGGAGAIASILLVAHDAERFVGPLRDILTECGGASFVDGRLLARLVAKDGYELRLKLIPAIKLLTTQTALPKAWML